MMTKTMRRWASGLAAVLFASFAGLNVLAWHHARAMTKFSPGGARTDPPEALTPSRKALVLLGGVNLPRPQTEHDPSSLAPDCRTLKLNGLDKAISLEAWYCDRGRTTPLVVMFHGYGTGKTSLLEEARALLEMGASVMLVDFRGSGGSSESCTTLGVLEAEDVAGVFAHAREQLPHRTIVLFGRSMGAAAIVRAVSQHGVQPDAVILEAVFDTMLNAVRNRFRAMRLPAFPSAELLVFWGGRQGGFNGFRHNVVAYASAVRCPALFLHGRNDVRARIEEARRVFEAVPGEKTMIVFEETGHESFLARHPGGWRAAIRQLLRRLQAGGDGLALTAGDPLRFMGRYSEEKE